MKLTEWCRDLAWKYRNGRAFGGLCGHVSSSCVFDTLSGDEVELIHREIEKLPDLSGGYKWPLSLRGSHQRADWLEALADAHEKAEEQHTLSDNHHFTPSTQGY